jgi:hypothetical protein
MPIPRIILSTPLLTSCSYYSFFACHSLPSRPFSPFSPRRQVFTLLSQPRHIFAKMVFYNKIKSHTRRNMQMKKTIAVVTVAALVLVIAASLVASAAPGQNQPLGPQRQIPTITEAQKQELAPLYSQMIEIQKQITQKYVDFGYITQWQADQRNAFMKERMEQRLQNGFIPGMGRGHGMMGKGPGFGRGGFGPGNGPCFQQQQPAANQ